MSHFWNPSIKKAQKFLYSKDVAIRSKGVRVGTIKGQKTNIKVKETISKDTDIRRFCKLFISRTSIDEVDDLAKTNLKRILNLSHTALKVNLYIMSILEQDKDYIRFSNKECQEVVGIGYNSVRIGIRELLEKGFIYESYKDGQYWIDCTLFYNGEFEKKSDEYNYANKNNKHE